MAEEEQKESKLASLKQNKMILFVIIGVVALLLIILIVVGILIFSGGDDTQTQDANQPTQSSASKSSVANPNSSLLNVGPMYPLDQFIVNLVSTGGGKRYLKTSIALEMSIAKMQSELDTKVNILRDTIISILASKTFEEIRTTRGKQKLKEEIIARLNEFVVDGRISNIFFTEFVVQ